MRRVAVAIWVLAVVGCGATPSQRVEVGSYEAEILLCVQDSKTLEESRTCREGVKARHFDGGYK